MMKGWQILGFVFCGLVIVSGVGCGKKGFPVPTITEKPPTIANIEAQIFKEGLELSWSIPSYDIKKVSDYPYCFVVEKAEIDWKGLSCVECPDLPWTFSKCIHPAYPDPAKIENSKILWKDVGVVAGHAYRYRISVNDRENKRSILKSKPVDVRIYESPDVIKKIASKTSDKGILLEWLVSFEGCKEPVGNIKFLVQRRKGTEGWVSLSDANYGNTSFLDSKIEAGSFYDYRVTPYYVKDSITVWGKPVQVNKVKSKSRLLPPPPESVWVVPGKDGLEVHWLETGARVGGYNIYRKQEDGSITRLNDKAVPRPPFIDKTAVINAVYSYAVSSVDADSPKKEGITSPWVEIRNVFTKPKEEDNKK